MIKMHIETNQELPPYSRFLPKQNAPTPKFIRLPKAGTTCPYTGLTRAVLNTLILPTADNGHVPPVRSFCLRRFADAKKGVRLIEFESLIAYIVAHQAQ